MTILNHTSDGLYSMVVVLYRALARLGPMPREELLSLCTAGIPAQHSGAKVADALRRWEKLGLFVERDGNMHIAAEPAGTSAVALDDLALNEQARQSILRLAFAPANVPDLWATEGSADFVRGLAWWMAQDCWRIDTASKALVSLESQQVPDPTLRIVNNEVRTDRLKEWVAFLGFGWVTARGLQFDPSAAIRRVLIQVLPKPGAKVPAEEFLARLAEALPVLDGGTYRSAVEARLNTAVWAATPAGWVSPSLGRALRRLSDSELRLERRADAHASIKIPSKEGSSASPWHEFTHVERLEAQA